MLARTRALAGRDFVTPDDVKVLAEPVLAHRITLAPEAEMEGLVLGDSCAGCVRRWRCRASADRVDVLRPGSTLIRISALAALAGLLVPLVPGFVWALIAVVSLFFVAAASEALLLRRVAFVVERPGRQVLALGVPERVASTLRLSTRHALDVQARQPGRDRR